MRFDCLHCGLAGRGPADTCPACGETMLAVDSRSTAGYLRRQKDKVPQAVLDALGEAVEAFSDDETPPKSKGKPMTHDQKIDHVLEATNREAQRWRFVNTFGIDRTSDTRAREVIIDRRIEALRAEKRDADEEKKRDEQNLHDAIRCILHADAARLREVFGRATRDDFKKLLKEWDDFDSLSPE